MMFSNVNREDNGFCTGKERSFHQLPMRKKPNLLPAARATALEAMDTDTRYFFDELLSLTFLLDAFRDLYFV